MLLELNKPGEALEAYKADLKKHPNRFNALNGAGLAAEKSGKLDEARFYYSQLMAVTNVKNSSRPELDRAKGFLQKIKS